jgi:peptidoglycan/xylan/chitin deacetylase (PgdA/CDA1 family)
LAGDAARREAGVIIRHIAQALSPAGEGARLSILIFHRVHAHPDPLFPDEPDIRRFHELIDWVSRWFTVLPLDVAAMRLRSASLPARAAAITFDDGYADNVSNALPVLLHHRIPATFFISTAFLDGGRMWNDSVIEALRRTHRREFDDRATGLGVLPLETLAQRRAAIDAVLTHAKYLEPAQRKMRVKQIEDCTGAHLPNDLMMRSDQLLALRDAGMQIGAHTVSHPILEKITDAQARREIFSSQDVLQTHLDLPVTLFAPTEGLAPTTVRVMLPWSGMPALSRQFPPRPGRPRREPISTSCPDSLPGTEVACVLVCAYWLICRTPPLLLPRNRKWGF